VERLDGVWYSYGSLEVGFDVLYGVFGKSEMLKTLKMEMFNNLCTWISAPLGAFNEIDFGKRKKKKEKKKKTTAKIILLIL
jgi:hypothetical protein